jgi:hypothetical protein
MYNIHAHISAAQRLEIRLALASIGPGEKFQPDRAANPSDRFPEVHHNYTDWAKRIFLLPQKTHYSAIF